MELPTAAELNLYDVEVPDGTELAVYPPAREHYWDPIWYNQAGLDPFDRKKIFRLSPGPQQSAKLKQILEEYPRYGPKMYERAAIEGNADVIRALFDIGVSLDIEKAKGKKIKEEEGESEEEEEEEVEENEEENENDVEWESEDDSDGEEDEDVPMVDMESALHRAAYDGHFECVKVLVERGDMSVNIRDESDSTALTNAAIGGHAEIVEWLLAQGAEIQINQEESLDDLQCAFKSGKKEIVSMIMESQQYINRGLKLSPEYLIYAAFGGNSDLVKLVLESECFPPPNGDIDSLTPEQKISIIDAIPQSTAKASVASLQLLLPYLTKRRADGSGFDYYELLEPNKSGVFNATEDAMEILDVPASFELVWETLLCPPADILSSSQDAQTRRDDWLHRRLISACSNGCPKTTKLLCEKYGANVDHISHKYFTTPLGRACGSGTIALPGRLEVARYLLSECSVDIHLANGEYANGMTPLAMAIVEGQSQADMVALLLEFGGPLDEKNDKLLGLANGLEDGKIAELYAVLREEDPRAPVRLLTKEQYESKTRKDGMQEVKLQVGKGDLEKWVENMQIRKVDSILAASDPKKRPLKSLGWP
jgi:ankyrin repeat protein